MTRPLVLLMAFTLFLLAAAPSASAITIFSTRPIDAVEGQEVDDHVLAEFSDEGACEPGDYAATVHWGDGDSPGAVGRRGAVNGSCVYVVRGDHIYVRAGSYPLSVTVAGTGEQGTSAASTATIREAAVRGEVLASSGVAGVPFGQEIAELHDDNRFSTAGDFAATIDWGDGSSSPGTVTGARGRYGVEGAHTYGVAGQYRVGVSVRHGGRTIVLDSATISVAPGGVPEGPPAPPAPAVPGDTTVATLRVLGSPLRLPSFRRRGLVLRVERGNSTATRARLELRRGRRVLQRATLRLPRSGSTVRVRWRPTRRAGQRLRAGRYVVRIRIAGLPTLEAAFRVRR